MTRKPTVTKITVDWTSHGEPIETKRETEKFFLVAKLSDGREVYSKAVPVSLQGNGHLIDAQFMADIIETTIGSNLDPKEAEKVLQTFAK